MEKKSGNTIDCTWPSVVLRLNRDKRERERKRKIFRSHYREFNSKARLRSNNKRRTKTFIFRTRRRLFARGLNWFLASRCLFHSPLSDTRSQESFVFSRIPFSSGSSEELYRRFNRWLVIVLNIISETVIQRCHRHSERGALLLLVFWLFAIIRSGLHSRTSPYVRTLFRQFSRTHAARTV